MLRPLILWLTLTLAGLVPSMQAADDILIADFEAPGYGDWKATGTAFGSGPAAGALPGQMAVEGYHGRSLVNTFHQGDGSTGTLTSPPITLQRKFLSFLIGGGKNPEHLALTLLVNGQVVRRATGPNDQPGGSEALAPDAWDVSDLLGQSAVIQIIDQATGGWGHVNVDHLVQTDRPPPRTLHQVRREIPIERRYLHFPIKNGPTRRVTTLVDGKVVVRNDMALADREPDWWAFMDVGEWKGKTVTIEVDSLRDDSKALTAIEQSDEIKGAESMYREPLRGQIHFSSRRGWNNDPNGLVYFNGEYHLFYQHNPYGWPWGNMHWGHAVSRDLVHWEELGDKLMPDDMGPMFSGCAVVDWNNTSGLGRDGKPPLVLSYNAAGTPAVQCLAWSLDGRTFTKWDGNPILKQITPGNRDPKIFWHEPTRRWVMSLYVEVDKVHTIQFFSSPNLKDWTYLSRVDGFFECPDFFELPVDGDPTRRRWVLIAASSEYQVGGFDGTTFTPETPKLPGHRGAGFYAAQTFSDIPETDGRRIIIGWFQTETKGMPFNQSMSLPMELKLVSTVDGPRMTWSPVRELAALRTRSHQFKDLELTPNGPNPLADATAELVELRVEIDPAEAKSITLTVRGAEIEYDTARQELVVAGQRAPAPLRDGRLSLTVYCDRTGLEVFASDGLTFVPKPFQPAADNRSLGLAVRGGPARLTALEVHELRSAWKGK
jgi:fructan beta-fructosidase